MRTPLPPVVNPSCFLHPIDFLARRRHFIDHLLPIWNELPDEKRGDFYIPAILAPYAEHKGLKARVCPSQSRTNPIIIRPRGGSGPLVTSAYGDLQQGIIANPHRAFILMEHGVGLTFGHPGYAGGLGFRTLVSLFLAPNHYIADKTSEALPHAPQEIIGTPKLDKWAGKFDEPREKIVDPTIAISFHWNGSAVAPEAGNAWEHYKSILPQLAKTYKIIGHGHPKSIETFAPVYRDCGIEVVYDFEEVMERADIYINDASSTMYEFCVTGKPVIILNAPWFRRNVHWGIRFWDFTDIGLQVDEPKEIFYAIDKTLFGLPETYREARKRVLDELYPHLGTSAKFAAERLAKFCGKKAKG